jgi:hypothetical protein
MARKIQDTVKYFPHDCNASEGDTLTLIEGEYGNDGYAFWFKLLEKLGKSNGHFIDCNDPKKLALLSTKAHITSEKGISIVEMLADLDAIDKELWQHKIIWSQHFVDNVSLAYSNRRRTPPSKPVITSSNPITTSNNSTITPNKKISTRKSTQTKLNETKRDNTKALHSDAAAVKNVLITVLKTEKRFDGIDADKLFDDLWRDHGNEVIHNPDKLCRAYAETQLQINANSNGGHKESSAPVSDDGMEGLKVIGNDLPDRNEGLESI